MKKKIKLLISLAGFCLSLAVFAFGVIAGLNVAYVAQGVINYEIEDSIVSIETRVYSTSKKFNSQEDFEEVAKNIEHSDFATLNAQTTLDEEYDFKSVQIKNTSTPSAFSETNKDYVDVYTNRDNANPPEDLTLDLDYQYKSDIRTMAYFVVIKVTNESPFTVYTQVKTTGEDGDDNIYQAPTNSYTFKTSKIEILEPAQPGQEKAYTYICFAMALQDASWEMEEVAFNYPISVNQDDPQNSIFDKPYVAQTQNTYSQTSEVQTEISSTGTKLANVAAQSYAGQIGYSLINLSLPTATSDIILTLSMSVNMGGEVYDLTSQIQDITPVLAKCVTIEECLANEGKMLSGAAVKSDDSTYYTITIPSSSLSTDTATDVTLVVIFPVDFISELSTLGLTGFDYTLATTQSNVMSNAITTVTEWGMVDFAKMGEEFTSPINVEVTTVSLGTDSISFSASLRNFQLRNIPENSEAIDITFTSSDKVQAVFVMNEQKEVITIMDMMMVLEGAVESISGLRDNTTTINFPITATEDGTMDFYICLFYYQTIVSDGEEIPLTVKVEFAEIAEAESPLLFELNTDSNFNLYYRVAGVKDSTATDITIPAYYKNLPVKEINSDAFQNNTTIQNVTFEEGAFITSIQSYQFTGCTNLQSVTFGENVQITSIGSYAFQNCSNLKNFEIPASVTTIYSNAFSSCGVETITFQDGSKLTSFSNNLFQNCTSLKTIEVPASITSIGSYAFSGCTSLSNVIFEEPSSLTTINSYAFQNCTSLTSIDLPSSVTTIGNYAFTGAGLTSIEVPNTITSLGEYAFYNCSSLTSATFEESSALRKINNYVFQNCTQLASIEIPNTITSIGNHTFSGCIALENIEFIQNINTIGSYAFNGCTGLTSLTIPSSVTSIGQYAFQNCSGLLEINYNTNNISAFSSNSYIFRYAGSTTSGCTVNFGSNVTTIPAYIFYQSYISQPIITSYVTSIGAYAFYNCTKITSITIPRSIQAIGNYAFANCSSVTEITYQTSAITSFTNGSNIFQYTGSTSGCVVNYDSRVTRIPSYLFNQSYISEPNITSNITIIGEYAFNGCTRIKTLNIPNPVYSIGSYAFGNCSAVTEIIYDAKYNNSSNYVFRYTGSTSGCIANFGSNVTAIASNLFYESYISQANISNNITSIGSSAFYNCTKLTNITIPSSVNSISGSAFTNCTAVTIINYNATEVTGMLNSYYIFQNTGSTSNGCVLNIGSTVTSIPEYMFRKSNISEVTIPSQITQIGEKSFENCSYLAEINYNAENVVYAHPFTQSGSTTNGCVVNFGSNVTNIPDYLFSASYISQVNLNNVQTIGGHAFSSCKYLTTIDIPTSVTSIGTYAFSSTGLTEVNFSTGVTSFGSGVFSSCTGLIDFVFPTSTDTISERMLYACSNLKTVTIPNSIKTIQTAAFQSCTSLTNVTIPDSVTTIESGAFTDCTSFTTITVPETVTSLGSSSFSRCSNVTQIIYNSNVDYNTNFDWYSPFYNTGSTTNGCVLTFGANVTSISAYLFYSSYISEVQIPDVIVTLDSGIFKNCTYLTTVTINSATSGLQYIGVETFYGCSILSSINLPSQLMSIENNAFYGCTSLATVVNDSPNLTVTAGSTEHGYVAYYATNVTNTAESSLTTINGINYYINGDDYIAHSLADTSLTEIVLQEQTTGIRSAAFKNCTNITTLTLPINVESIGESAFNGCTKLHTITCDYENSKLKIISNSAFKNCTSLTSINIPSNVVQIGSSAFNGCSSVEQININSDISQYLSSESLIFGAVGSTVNGCKLYFGSHLKDVPDYLFYSSNISEIEIHKNIERIGINAFTSSVYLTKVIFEEGSLLTKLDSSAFRLCSSLSSFEIPGNVITIGSAAFSGCTSLASISIPSSVKEIESSAFCDCSSLNSLTIPETVEVLGDSAFKNCSSLTEINYNANILGSVSMYSNIFGSAGSTVNGCVLTIGNNVTKINTYLFQYSYISQAVISSQVQEIQSYAFSSLSYLKTVTIPAESNLQKINSYAFAYSSQLETIDMPISIISIGDYAFNDCTGLLSITVPENVTSIGKYAFNNCSGLTEIYLYGQFDGNYSGYINNYTFANVGSSNGCTLTIGKNCRGFTNDFIGAKITELITLEGADIDLGYQCFKDNTYLKKVAISNSVTYLSNSVFENCTSLEEMYYDSTYWYNATSSPKFFKNAGSSTNGFVVTIGNTLTKISRYLFTDSNVSKLIIPENVQIIETSSFTNCTKLLTIINKSPYFKIIAGDNDNAAVGKYATSVTNEAENYLTEINGINYYTLSDGSYLAYGLYNQALTEIVFQSNTTAIRSRAFESCTSLITLTIPESITFIGARAFQECTGLKQINYNSNDAKRISNTSLSWNPFYHAGSIDRGCVVNFGANINTIQSTLFQYSYISNAEIASSITELESSIFSSCTYLVSIIIPESIVNIKSSCFYNCTSLTDVYYRGSIGSFNEILIASSNDAFKNANIHYCYGWTVVSETPATCTESGVAIYQKDGKTEQITLEALGHNIVNNICTRCGEEFRVSATVTETASGSSYGFINSNGTYTSNNKNVHSSSAIAEISTTTGCTLTINWTVSSESNYDKLYIYLNGSVQSSVNGVSGSQNGTLTLNLAAGDVVQIKYQKDGSSNGGSDCATFTFTYQ